MRLEYQVLCAFGLDLLLGDPRWLPHPVRLIGYFAQALESPLRRAIRNPRTAGIAAALTVIGVTAAASWTLLRVAAWAHPAAGTLASILILYTTLAGRDLAHHAMNVYRALKNGDLAEARRRVSWMVGRDTAGLDEAGVVRAAVESVAENTVDGVTAPLFYAVFFGPVGAMAYKAASTLDSTFGYRNERYIQFGWASARIDDVANCIPARLTLPLIALAAALLRLHAAGAWRIGLRDRRKHASPNSGIPESAMAGALGVQLGGLLHRKGKPVEMPRLGDPLTPLARFHIPSVAALMLLTAGLAAAAFIGLRALWIGW